MQQKTPKRHMRLNSIRWKILISMAAVMIVQALLFSGVILFGGVLQKLNDNAFDILNGRVSNSRDHLAHEMGMRWSSLDNAMKGIGQELDEQLTLFEKDFSALNDSNFADSLTPNLAPYLVQLLRGNATTGAFVILGADPEQPAAGEKKSKTCIYIRDDDPSTQVGNNSDLQMAYGPISVARRLNITLSENWWSRLNISGDAEAANAYASYYKPLQAGVDYPDVDAQALGYWSYPYRMNETDKEVITYSIPLRSPDGRVCGVLGVEISVEYLTRLLSYQELSEQGRGAYWLGISQQPGVFDRVAWRGTLRNSSDDPEMQQQVLTIDSRPVRGDVYQLHGKEDYYASVQYLSLYQPNSPFEQDRWAIIGIVEESVLLGFTYGVRNAVVLAFVISLALGLMGVLVASRLLTKPLVALVDKMHQTPSEQLLQMEKTNIFEIDELTAAIQHFNVRAVAAAAKLAQIVDMAGIPIGAFEYRTDEHTVIFTGQFFKIMQMEPIVGRSPKEETALFVQMMRGLGESIEHRVDGERVEHTFERFSKDGTKIWVSLRSVADGARVIGVVTDVTKQMLQRLKIERERDYDHLTGLYNRRAFIQEMTKLFDHPATLKIAAAIMLDLDNLKYINDTFGHDFGDSYLKETALLLKNNTPSGTVIARMSGDEFYLFYYGYDSADQLRVQINRLRTSILDSSVAQPDGSMMRVRLSAGIAWYPKDSDNVMKLLKYADFAMYKVKNTTKGEFIEFNQDVYDREEYLLSNKEELNRLIDQQLVEYYFQPIVDVRTGLSFAYEALMRPTLYSLRQPIQVMMLARNQFKLYQIERLTWFKALEQFCAVKDRLPPECRIFVNSIANQVLTDEDLDDIESRFSDVLERLVVEVTESEQVDEYSTQKKKERVKKWNSALALDDFGTGYNSDVALISLTPDYVKIDMSIVRNVHIDSDRQTILKNLISYSKERGIRVIAEGVENTEEMNVLMRFGVDYLQGFYVGRPAPMPQDPIPAIQAEIVEVYKRYH